MACLSYDSDGFAVLPAAGEAFTCPICRGSVTVGDACGDAVLLHTEDVRCAPWEDMAVSAYLELCGAMHAIQEGYWLKRERRPFR